MTTFSLKIDLSLADEIKKGLLEQGFQLSDRPYTLFSGTKNKLVVTCWKSGKLTIQGQGSEDWISFYLEPEVLKSFPFSNPNASQDRIPKIGVDEAGKGDFFGPLVVAAVYADEEGIEALIKLGVKDSKELSDAQSLALGRKIRSSFPYEQIVLQPETYNRLYSQFRNLNDLLAWGHATAIEELQKKTGSKRALIDKFAHESKVETALARKKVKIELEQKTKGESDLIVAAASILARSGFLEGLEKLSKIVDSPLPKGAGPQVLVEGRKIYNRLGEEGLASVSKVHFKTWREIVLDV